MTSDQDLVGVQPARRHHVVQGDYSVSDDPQVVLTTLLGSCVAACICDPIARVGGMNHFLLPGDDRDSGDESLRYGVNAMELLINGLIAKGARRNRLEAKLFGGGRMMHNLGDVGELNVSFAERFLRDEGIAYVGGSVGGDQGRRVQYWPVTGRARQSLMTNDVAEVIAAERRSPVTPEPAGALELF